ncbi:MAG: hypothetical protein JW881_07690 [Spirochaetales bacterium]|nr:hypothetical protein [Spirochaetales bacterium]
MTVKKKRFSFLPPLLACSLSLLYFLFHFHFIPRYIDYDQALYGYNIITAIKRGTYPVFNPHHLLETSAGVFFHSLINGHLGNAGFDDIMFNNRLRSLLFACCGIFFTVLYLFHSTGKPVWAVLGGLLVGVCHGYLVFAVKVDTAIYPAAGMIATLWFFERMDHAKRFIFLYAAAGGIILFVDIMFHQYMGIACCAFCIALGLPSCFFPGKAKKAGLMNHSGRYLEDRGILADSGGLYGIGPLRIIPAQRISALRKSPGRRYLCIGIITAICLSATTAAYFYAGKSVYHLPFDKPSPVAVNGPFKNTTFQTWIFRYATFSGYGHGFRQFDPRQSFRGLTNAFLSPTVNQTKRYDELVFQYDMKEMFGKESRVFNLVALFCLLVLAGVIVFFPFMWIRYGRSFFFILLSFVLFSVFTAYWEPDYFEFWLIPCLLLCILSIQLLAAAGEGLEAVFGGFSHIPFYACMLFFILSLFSFNSERHIIPYSQRSRIEELYPPWTEETFRKLFSDGIYNDPLDPYKTGYPDDAE